MFRLAPLCGALTLLPHLGASEIYATWASTRFTDIPAQNIPLEDPDNDGQANIVEFAFGTDPRSGTSTAPVLITLKEGSTTGIYTAEILELRGHQPGVQIDLELSDDLLNWFRPWWRRSTIASEASDPSGSVRESFTTRLPARANWFARPTVTVIDTGLETANYYVAPPPTGSDSNPGTFSAPYATIKKAVEAATAGQFVYIRGGTYSATTKISLSRTATAASPIRIRAYPGEHPILDVSATSGTSQDAVTISGSYYYIYGLEIVGAAHNSIRITGNYNTVENCISRAARNTGFHVSGGNGATVYPANNLILNCDSIRSYDAPVGGNADGFSAKWSLGTGNVFRGCRAIENSDDGWDLWMGTQAVLIENCWAVRSGIDVWQTYPSQFNGNGQGFKLGGNNIGAPHRLVRGLSWGNKAWGIDQNNNAMGQTVDNNVCWNNASGVINLNHVGVTLVGNHTVRNNVAIGGTGSAAVSIGGTAPVSLNNSWQILPDVVLNDFLDSDIATWMTASRRDDGGLPGGPFMKSVPAGRLVDIGTAISGDTYNGTAPDLGANETSVW